MLSPPMCYVREHFKRAWEEKQRTISLAMSVLQRRLASSTYAISCSLENRWKRLRELREVVMRDPLTVRCGGTRGHPRERSLAA